MRRTVIIVFGEDGERAVAWRQTSCCRMWYTEGSPAFDTGELVASGAARHARTEWCVETRPWGEALPVCYTCDDTGLVRRVDGRTALCPMHCDAAWSRLEATLA